MGTGSNKAHILIVDDIEANREILAWGLAEHGYSVRTASSGADGIPAIGEAIPDMILLDVLMPGMDGYEVCRRIKAQPQYGDIPIIFVTALSETVDKIRGFEVGGIDYLTKPFDFREVLVRIDTHLTLFHQRREIERLLAEREAAQAAEHQQHMMVSALLRSAVGLSSTLKLDEVLTRILSDVGQAVPHDTAMIVLIENGAGWVASFHSTLPYNWRVPTPKFAVREIELIDIMAKTRRPYIIPDIAVDPLWIEVPEHEALHSYIGAPIFADDTLIGILSLLAYTTDFYTAESSNWLEAFAPLASLSIKNARLYEQAQELAIVQERQRLARELHDSISQTLFAANAIAEVITKVQVVNPDKAGKYIPELAQLTREAMAEMRSLLFELRPEALTRTELRLLMKQLCDTFALKTQTGVALRVPDQLFLSDQAQIAVYRIAQESLNNIAKHAHATEVNLSMNRRPNGLELRVSDNGSGFDVQQVPMMLGIQGMRERASSIGAELEIHSVPGRGTEVILRGVSG